MKSHEAKNPTTISIEAFLQQPCTDLIKEINSQNKEFDAAYSNATKEIASLRDLKNELQTQINNITVSPDTNETDREQIQEAQEFFSAVDNIISPISRRYEGIKEEFRSLKLARANFEVGRAFLIEAGPKRISANFLEGMKNLPAESDDKNIRGLFDALEEGKKIIAETKTEVTRVIEALKKLNQRSEPCILSMNIATLFGNPDSKIVDSKTTATNTSTLNVKTQP